MKMQFQNNEEFNDFKQELREKLDSREKRDLENPEYRRSAVKIIIMNKNGAPCVLLTQRTDKVRTHKGQISLPGGSYDEEDGHILETAYRETEEEVGIPKEKIEYIGQFDDFISIFGFHVSCFIGAVDYPVEYKFNPDEIQAFIEAPLSMFVNEEFEKIENMNYQGNDYRVFFYNFEGQSIWGLTARILTDFSQKVLRD